MNVYFITIRTEHVSVSPILDSGTAKRANAAKSRENARGTRCHVIFTRRNGGSEGVGVVGVVCI